MLDLLKVCVDISSTRRAAHSPLRSGTPPKSAGRTGSGHLFCLQPRPGQLLRTEYVLYLRCDRCLSMRTVMKLASISVDII